MVSYSAHIVHDAGDHSLIPGQLEIQQHKVYFKSEGQHLAIDLQDLHIHVGGTGKGMVYFSSSKHRDFTFITTDKTILADPLLVQHPQVKLQVKKSRRRMRRLLYSLGTLASLLVLLLFGILVFRSYLVEKLAQQVPRTWEKEAGDAMFSTLTSEYKLIKNDSLKIHFLRIAQPLLKQVKKQGVEVDLYFADRESINAFALPGGKVVIHTGLISKAESWEEVLGVLAHELAHVTRRHHIRSAINDMGFFALISALLGDMSGIAEVITNTGGELASLANSREFENEADASGWEYLLAAHIDPHGMITLFETLEKQSERGPGVSFLSTHPELSDRIALLKQKAKGLQQIPALEDDFKAFKKLLYPKKQPKQSW